MTSRLLRWLGLARDEPPVFVPAAPGFAALHVVPDSSPANPLLIVLPVIAWQIDRDGHATPVPADSWGERGDDGSVWALELPTGGVIGVEHSYTTRVEYVASYLQGARAPTT